MMGFASLYPSYAATRFEASAGDRSSAHSEIAGTAVGLAWDTGRLRNAGGGRIIAG
jgi:hypothetical protein